MWLHSRSQEYDDDDDDLPAEWRGCDFLCEGQILFGGDETDTVPKYVFKKTNNLVWLSLSYLTFSDPP